MVASMAKGPDCDDCAYQVNLNEIDLWAGSDRMFLTCPRPALNRMIASSGQTPLASCAVLSTRRDGRAE
jgi:hypothetical protein